MFAIYRMPRADFASLPQQLESPSSPPPMLVKRNVSRESELVLPTTCRSCTRRSASTAWPLLLCALVVSVLLLLVGRQIRGQVAAPLPDTVEDRTGAPLRSEPLVADGEAQEGPRAAEVESQGESEAACTDHREECRLWAQAGECARNPDFMHAQCPLSCKVCGAPAVEAIEERRSTPVPVAPKVESSLVAKLRDLKPAEAAKKPQLAQQSVPAEACNDTNPRCADWAQAGECTRNPSFMSSSCRRACGVCTLTPAGTGLGA